MIAKKFPDKVRKEDSRQANEYASPNGTRQNPYAVELPPWASIHVLEDYRRRSYRICLEQVNMEILYHVLRMMDENNIRRNGRKLYCTYDDWNRLRGSHEFQFYGNHPDIGMILGMEVVLDRGNDRQSYIEVYR